MKKSFLFLLSFLFPIIANSQANYSNNTFYNATYSSSVGFNNVTGLFGAGQVYYSLASGSSNSVFPGVNSSQVFGDKSKVVGYASFVAGSFSSVYLPNINNCFAIGQWVSASANNSMVIGTGRWSSTQFANNFHNNIANSLMISFNNTTTAPTAPSMFVGPIGTYNGYSYSLGCVGIGTTNTKGHLFAVNGNMVTTKLKVASYANWPDYVFEEDYRLQPLIEVEQFISKNHHLPGIDNRLSVSSNGYDIANMDSKLLEHIEQLYLYIIEIHKKNKILSERIIFLEKNLK